MANIPFFIGLWITITLFNICACGRNEDVGIFFTLLPEDVVAVRGHPLSWDCQAATNDSQQPVTIKWRHLDTGFLLDSRQVHVLENGSLYFRKVKKGQRSHEGTYQCLASSSQIGTIASAPVKLSVAVLSHFSVEPENTTTTEGATIHLHCHIQGTPQPAISWEKNRQALPHNHRYTVLSSGNLQIQSVNVTDEGQYRCVAKNIVKTRISEEAQLSVIGNDGTATSLPQFLVQPQNQLVVEGELALLECAATGLPQPTVHWTKDGQPIAIQTGHYNIVGQASLEIPSVSAGDDTGMYTCIVTQGTEQISASAELKVQVPPSFAMADASHVINKSLTFTTRLPCSFSGIPKPDIHWTHAGLPVTVTTVPMNYIHVNEINSLVISKTAMFNQGVYQCWARNSAGVSVANFRLNVIAKGPPPPTNLQGRALSDNEIQLSWDYSEREDVISFVVYYETKDVTVKETVYSVNDDRTQVLSNLRAFSNYTICMLAYTKDGASVRTPHITVQTEEGVPLVMPHINATASAQSVRIEWSPLSVSEAQGIVTSYRIVHRIKDDVMLFRQTVAGNTKEYTITDLRPDTVYEIKIYPGTRKGYLKDKNQMEWTTVRTSVLDPKGVPEPPDLVLDVREQNTVEVRWKNPPPGTPRVLGYDLKYRKTSPTIGDWIKVETTGVNNIYTLSNLEPSTWYDVQLQAFNNEGRGQYVIKSVRTNKKEKSTDWIASTPIMPLPPQNVQAKPQSATSVVVSWLPPDSDNISMYSIQYHNADEDNSSLCNTNTTATSIVIDDLRPYTLYKFKVQVVHKSGSRALSDVVGCRTFAGIPSAPNSLNGHVNSESSVFLEWLPPRETNGVIITYIIFYSLDKNQPDNSWRQKRENGSVNAASVEDLQKNVMYYFKLRAATAAGPGPPTNTLPLETVVVDPGEESRMGIIIGACIGGGCFIICVLIVIFRNRLCPPLPPPQPTQPVPFPHGNGYYTRCNQHMTPTLVLAADHNYETTPMLDSKGASGGCTEQMNGLLPINGLQAAVMSNGEIRTFLVQECMGMDRNSGPVMLQAIMSNGHCSHQTSRDGSMDDIDRHSEVTNSDVVMSNMADTPCSDPGKVYSQQPPGEMETSFVDRPAPPTRVQRLSTCSHSSTDNPCGCPNASDIDNATSTHDAVNGNIVSQSVDTSSTPLLGCGAQEGHPLPADGTRPPPNSPLPLSV